MSQEALTWWFKEGSVYGFAVVFMGAVLFGVLWVAYQGVTLLKFWLPRWFQSTIDLQTKLSKSLDDFSAGMSVLVIDSEVLRSGLHGTLIAINRMLKDRERAKRLGIESDVIFEFDRAEKAMRRRSPIRPDDTITPPDNK